ncbi:unannotated protein [freshwater metagenome]|uniref:Unannotated protein n=1 Tax=freshwater metagenome TaxID=449393 RepID=A0A6J7KDC2_9ZZZZ|nr:hypothetical protein [Actinomycetota bacterium]
MDSLRCNVADLLHRPAARRLVVLSIDPEELGGVGQTRLVSDEPVSIKIAFEHVSDSIVVNGQAEAVYELTCSRCLEPIRHPVAAPVRELFEQDPIEGQTYKLEGDEIDLGGPIRDNILLQLPSAALCKEDCVGLCLVCGVNRNTDTCDCDLTVTDPRWDALKDIKID